MPSEDDSSLAVLADSSVRIGDTIMSGSLTVTFSELFADTALTHGIEWAYNYYVKTHNMPFWEFKFWANSLGFNEDGYY